MPEAGDAASTLAGELARSVAFFESPFGAVEEVLAWEVPLLPFFWLPNPSFPQVLLEPLFAESLVMVQ